MAAKPFYVSSSFWTHVAGSATGIATSLTGVFDPNFVNNHPALSITLTIGGILLTSVSQVAYLLAKGIAAQGSTVVVPATNTVG